MGAFKGSQTTSDPLKAPAEKSGSGSEGNSCPLCGNSRFTWGKAMGHYPQKFKPDDSGWLAKNTAFGGMEIKARRCDSCGNIQLFVVK
jgi:hypothetical protein